MEVPRSTPGSLLAAWRAVGHQAAVTLGAAVALLSLLADTPVHVASLRGGIAWAATLVATSVGAWLLDRTYVARDAVAAEDDEEGAEAPTA
ncbi:MAG: hypothetical protein AAFZ87_11215 [Planctomycetota bacterium]